MHCGESMPTFIVPKGIFRGQLARKFLPDSGKDSSQAQREAWYNFGMYLSSGLQNIAMVADLRV
jgi:hypothetical protein